MARLLRSYGVSKLRQPTAVGPAVTFRPLKVTLSTELTVRRVAPQRIVRSRLRPPTVVGSAVTFAPNQSKLAPSQRLSRAPHSKHQFTPAPYISAAVTFPPVKIKLDRTPRQPAKTHPRLSPPTVVGPANVFSPVRVEPAPSHRRSRGTHSFRGVGISAPAGASFTDTDTGVGTDVTSRGLFDTDTGSGADPESAATGLVWNEDFETGTVGSIFSLSVNASLDTTQGVHAQRSFLVSGDPAYGLHVWGSGAVTVFRCYIRLAFIPSQGIELLTLNGGPRFGIDGATHKFGWVNGTAQTMDSLSTVTPNAGQWYRLDVRLSQTVKPWVIDYQFDGVAETQITYPSLPSTTNGVYLGHTTGFTVPVQVNYDDAAVSQTSADYPIGPSFTPKSSTDTGSGSEATLSVGFNDYGFAADTENLQPLNAADTGSGADVGSVDTRKFVTDTDAGTDVEVENRNAAYVDPDTGAGGDAQTLLISSARGYDTEVLTTGNSSLDTGSGADAHTIAQSANNSITAAESGTGTDVTGRVVPDTDVGAGIDVGGIGNQTFFVVQDEGGSISRITPHVSDTDTGVGNEGYPGLIGPLWTFWGALDWGAFLTVTDTDTATGAELLLNTPRVLLVGAEAPVSTDVGAATQAGNTLVSGVDAGVGLDVGARTGATFIVDTDLGVGAEAVNRGIASSDTNATVDVAGVGILDSDSGLGLDAEKNLLVSADTGSGADPQTFTITSTDTGSGADASLAVTYKDGDAGVGLETFNQAKVDAEAGVGADTHLLSAAIRFIDSDSNSSAVETTRVNITQSDTGTGTEKVGSSNDNGFGLETTILRVVGLVVFDIGVGHSFGTISLPFPPDPTGILTLAGDTPGALTLAAASHGSRSISVATSGTSTLTPDSPGSLVLVADGDTQE